MFLNTFRFMYMTKQMILRFNLLNSVPKRSVAPIYSI